MCVCVCVSKIAVLLEVFAAQNTCQTCGQHVMWGEEGREEGPHIDNDPSFPKKKGGFDHHSKFHTRISNNVELCRDPQVATFPAHPSSFETFPRRPKASLATLWLSSSSASTVQSQFKLPKKQKNKIANLVKPFFKDEEFFVFVFWYDFIGCNYINCTKNFNCVLLQLLRKTISHSKQWWENRDRCRKMFKK